MQLWLPETRGPVEPAKPAHQALMLLLGGQSEREVLRSRFRTRAAMRAQAAVQGRFLGGRPPYGYRLVDAGPHPNGAHARWGRRLQKLEPDPATAPYARWSFAQRLCGVSVASIARSLNERGVPCPSNVDRERNPHRSGEAWLLRTVAAILENPRYTGRQIWDRCGQRGWVVSQKRSHPALVSDEDFVAAQAIRAARPTRDGSTRVYLLAGLLRCAVCLRRMDAHWVNDRPGYRCRHGHTSARRQSSGSTKFFYVREDRVLAALFGDRQPEPLIAVLRAKGQVVVCDRGICRISTKELVPGNELLILCSADVSEERHTDLGLGLGEHVWTR
ncbi:recombinase family protein [Nonomuraea sp. NPDC050556]|uniref:recombinase family protein n=1 Tax=Nonomuraea sp. NPDC050556 TaxID=3364369 RepID=UPI00379C8FF6